MKKLIFAILSVLSSLVYGQSSEYIFLKNRLEELYPDTVNLNLLYDVNLDDCDSVLMNVFYTKDTAISNLLNWWTNFRRYLADEDGNGKPPYDGEKEFFTHATDFQLFQEYLPFLNTGILDTLIARKQHWLIDYLPEGSDTSFLINRLIPFTSIENQSYYFSRLIKILDTSSLTEYYNQYRSSLMPHFFLFRNLIVSNVWFGKPILDRNVEAEYFLQYYDTSNTIYNDYYKYTLKNYERPKTQADYIKDSLNDIFVKEYNNRLHLENERREAIRDSLFKIEFDSTFHIRFPFLHQQYIARQDTTLYGTVSGKKLIYLGDDGRRFDTYSNDSLVILLDSLQLLTLYDTSLSYFSLDTITAIVYSRKILQLLGDRYLVGSFTPNPAQESIIYAIANHFADLLNANINGDLRSDLKTQLLRLWTMIEPLYYQWIISDRSKLFITLCDVFYLQANESMVQQIIQMADDFKNNGDPVKARTILDLFSRLDGYFEFAPGSRLPVRRPEKDVNEITQMLRLLIPAYERHEYFYKD